VNSTVSLERFGATPLLTFSPRPTTRSGCLVKRVTDILISGPSRPGGARAVHVGDRPSSFA